MTKTKKETEVSRLVVGMYSAFPRATMISEAALGIWVFALKDYPTKQIRQAVSKVINSQDWPPDSLNKFLGIVSGGGGFTKAEEADPPGYRDFLKQYREEGLGRGPSPEPPDNSHEPKTPAYKASIWWKLIRDISQGRVRCPPSIRKGDIYATDDAEARWIKAEFEKRLRASR